MRVSVALPFSCLYPFLKTTCYCASFFSLATIDCWLFFFLPGTTRFKFLQLPMTQVWQIARSGHEDITTLYSTNSHPTCFLPLFRCYQRSGRELSEDRRDVIAARYPRMPSRTPPLSG